MNTFNNSVGSFGIEFNTKNRKRRIGIIPTKNWNNKLIKITGGTSIKYQFMYRWQIRILWFAYAYISLEDYDRTRTNN